MKALITILIFCSLSFTATARDWYRIYLVTEISKASQFKSQLNTKEIVYPGAIFFTGPSIPHFERPKGAIFCRMEDYLTTKTKVWIKVGVK
jgi:hypothetical protein